MTQTALIYKDGAFHRNEARMVVMTRGQYGDGAPTHAEVAEAEREIIAAVESAPDMLAALEKLLLRWGDYIYAMKAVGEPDSGPYITQARVYEAQARAAIAKATGKAVQS